VIYNLYLSFGQLGISGLSSYQITDQVRPSPAPCTWRHGDYAHLLLTLHQKWTSAHDRARFGIMRALIAADGFMTVVRNNADVTVRIDRDRITTDARRAVTELATRLHLIVMTADKAGADQYFTALTKVEGEWLEIREIVVRKSGEEAPRIYVQANTIPNEDGSVTVVEYEPTVEGVIQSWMERGIGDDEDDDPAKTKGYVDCSMMTLTGLQHL
jgi:hypothetical protein